MTRPQVGDRIPLFKKIPAEPYQRPADWLEMPKLTEGDQKVVGLHAVFPHDSNLCAFTVEGAYTVDWGDGSSPQNYNSGDTAYHIFDYDDLGAETECSRGYRQAIVTIVPQAGQDLTSINFGVMHNQPGLNPGYGTNWIDVRVVGEEIEKYSFESWDWGIYKYVITTPMLEVFSFIGENNIIDFDSMFSNCYSLQQVIELYTSRGVIFSGMFFGCHLLQVIPQLDTSNGEDFSFMFSSCYSLQTIPQLDTSNGIDFSQMFNLCYSLISIPKINTLQCANFEWMFYSCFSLQSIPLFDTRQGLNFHYMFAGCDSLQFIPQLDVSDGDDFGDMFYNCPSLSSAPL